MKTEISEKKWLELVKERRTKHGGNGVLREVYEDICHKAHEYIFYIEDGEPKFPKHKMGVK